MARETQKKAVALAYDGERAPVVTASGQGIVAEKIIEAAREHGVFIEQSPLLAEALSSVEMGDEIPVELYQAVAEVIGFILSMDNR